MADFSHYGGSSDEWLKVEATLPEPVPGQSLADLKRINNENREATSKREMEVLTSKVTIQNHTIPTRDGSTIEARSYRPVSSPPTQHLPVYLTFHGGGFLFGTIDTEDAACSRIIAAGVPCVVLNVNYRHTPEHTYPTSWNDTEDAFDWLHAHLDEVGADPSKVIVGGISAGGYMTASLVLNRHHYNSTTRQNNTTSSERPPNHPKIIGQLLLIPCLVTETNYDAVVAKLKDPSLSCYIENEFAPILPQTRRKLFNDLLKVPKPVDPSDRRLNPGLASAEEVRGLPPTVFGIAGLDPLRDEALFYAQLLAENGVPTDVNLFKGVPHGFRRFGDRLTASKYWDEVIAGGINWILSNPEASNKFEVKVRQ